MVAEGLGLCSNHSNLFLYQFFDVVNFLLLYLWFLSSRIFHVLILFLFLSSCYPFSFFRNRDFLIEVYSMPTSSTIYLWTLILDDPQLYKIENTHASSSSQIPISQLSSPLMRTWYHKVLHAILYLSIVI